MEEVIFLLSVSLAGQVITVVGAVGDVFIASIIYASRSYDTP